MHLLPGDQAVVVPAAHQRLLPAFPSSPTLPELERVGADIEKLLPVLWAVEAFGGVCGHVALPIRV